MVELKAALTVVWKVWSWAERMVEHLVEYLADLTAVKSVGWKEDLMADLKVEH